MTNRRRFLEGCGTGLGGLLAASAGLSDWRDDASAAGIAGPGREIAADVVIVGGGLGGCAAALAALRAGRTVIMTEPTDWIGGQLTSQAVPPDEHPWIEQFGANASYQSFRRGIREYYLGHYPMTAEARRVAIPQPGQWRRLQALPRAEGRARRVDRYAGALCLQREAPELARARSGPRGCARRTRSRGGRPRPEDRTRTNAGRPVFSRRDRAGRLAADGGRRVRDRRRGSRPDRRAARGPLRPTEQSAGDHLLLRRRVPRRTGPHHRPARRVRLLARLRPGPEASLAGSPARPDLQQPHHAPAGQPRLRSAWRRSRALDLPANPRPAQLPARCVSRQLGHHARQLAAERLFARPDGRRRDHGRRRREARRACQAAQPVAACTGSRPNAPDPTASSAGRA